MDDFNTAVMLLRKVTNSRCIDGWLQDEINGFLVKFSNTDSGAVLVGPQRATPASQSQIMAQVKQAKQMIQEQPE